MGKIKLAKISIDGGTQPRVDIDEDLVAEYADDMQDGDKFPPVVLYNDGAKYWLADGFHRYHASKKVGYIEIEAEVKNGTKREAVLFSVSANGKHGKRRTNADKRKAVKTLLRDEEWSQWSDREIARQAEVSNWLVSEMRKDLTVSNSQSNKRKGADGRTIDTSNIGSKSKSKEGDNVFDTPSGRDEKPNSILKRNDIDQETDEVSSNEKDDERKGIGLRKAHEAISTLKEIPPNDDMLQDAYNTVTQWINDNR